MDGASAMLEQMDDRIEGDTVEGQGPASDADASERARQAAADDATPIEPRRVVEAVLFAADSPIPAAKVASILGVGNAADVRKHVADLNEEYESRGQSFRIDEVAGGYQMLTLPVYNTWLAKLLRARQETKLSSAAMETLAVVAYKQPVTRAEIEAVRGVAAGEMLNRLREINLVKIVGRAEDLGRPLLYGTTKRFLEVFGLASLEDLPQVEALASGAKSTAAKTTTQAAAAESVVPEQSHGASSDDEEPTDGDKSGPLLTLVEGDDESDNDRSEA